MQFRGKQEMQTNAEHMEIWR